MIISNYYEDNPDLQFVIEHFIDWERLLPLHERNFADAKEYHRSQDERLMLAPSDVAEALENYRAVLLQIGEFSGKKVAPAAREIEESGLDLKNGKVIFPEIYMRLFDMAVEAGYNCSFALPRRVGGLQMPLVTVMALKEMLTRADNSFEIAIAVTFLAQVLYRYAPQELIDAYLAPMMRGQYTAAMGLSEPDFGSDLSHIRTWAKKEPDGSYRITGTKRFITHGCGVGNRPALIFTLARTSNRGARGLSFFLVKSSDVEVSRIEHKLGLTCSPTCELVYDNTPAHLIGVEGIGLVKYVAAMLNSGRIGVAIESVGVAQAAYEEACKYAGQRIQFGTPIEEIPAVQRMLQEMDALLQSMRALVYRTAQLIDIEISINDQLAEAQMEVQTEAQTEIQTKVQTERQLTGASANEQEADKRRKLLRLDRLTKLLTSVSKFICSEYANRVAYEALQVFGGVGFTEEYDIARIYRDARISTIYEGTTQIHINTTVSLLTEGLKNGAFVEEYILSEIGALQDDDRSSLLRGHLSQLQQLCDLWRQLERKKRDYLAKDIAFYFGHLFSLILLALQLERAEQNCPDPFVRRKRAAFENYLLLSEAVFASARLRLNKLEMAAK